MTWLALILAAVALLATWITRGELRRAQVAIDYWRDRALDSDPFPRKGPRHAQDPDV